MIGTLNQSLAWPDIVDREPIIIAPPYQRAPFTGRLEFR